MTAGHQLLIFDTGPLSHFARAGWLEVLKDVVGDARQAVIPDIVARELRVGARRHAELSLVLTAEWISHRTLATDDQIKQFANFSELLVTGDRHVGEAAVLALAATEDATAVVDDAAARKAAQTHGIRYKPTLSLIFDAISGGMLTLTVASDLADDLIESEYRLPFERGGFERWLKDNHLLP